MDAARWLGLFTGQSGRIVGQVKCDLVAAAKEKACITSGTITQSDAPAERRDALQAYRDELRLWLSWIDTDDHHAIWDMLSSMVWTDVAFKMLTRFAIDDEHNALNGRYSTSR